MNTHTSFRQSDNRSDEKSHDIKSKRKIITPTPNDKISQSLFTRFILLK